MNHARGFIALVSIILISVVLLLTVVVSNFSNYVARYNIFNSELKGVSVGLAEACANIAILNLAKDFTYTVATAETHNVNGKACKIISVQPGGSGKIIKAQANFPSVNGAYTNLQIEVQNTPSFGVVSWDEVVTLP